MDCSLSGSSVHRIFQAKVLEWIAISFSRGSSRPRNRTQVSSIAGRPLTVWATRERRRQWQPTPVLLPGKSLGRRSLIGYSPWGRKESDTAERLHFHFQDLAKVTGELIKQFFFIIIFFNWTMIALQCCVAFCQSTTWISHKYMYVPSLPPTEKFFIMIWLKPLTGLAGPDA